MEKETSLAEALRRTIDHDLALMQRLFSSVASEPPADSDSLTSGAFVGHRSPRKAAETLPGIRAAHTKAYDSVKQITGLNSSVTAEDALLYHLSTSIPSQSVGRLLSDIHTLLVSADRLLSVQPWPSTSAHEFCTTAQNALRFVACYLLRSSWSWPIGSDRRRFLCCWAAALWNRLLSVCETGNWHSLKGIPVPAAENELMEMQMRLRSEPVVGGETGNSKDEFFARLRDVKNEASHWIAALTAEANAARTDTDFFATDQFDKRLEKAAGLFILQGSSDEKEKHLPDSPDASVVTPNVKIQNMEAFSSSNAALDEQDVGAPSTARNYVVLSASQKTDAEGDPVDASLKEEESDRHSQGDRPKARQAAPHPLKKGSNLDKRHTLVPSLVAESPDEDDTERFLFQAAEVMRETAQRYGQVLAQDKKILEATAEEADDHFSMTHAAVQTIRLFSWGQKMSFLQEVFLFVGSGVLFCVMISFILLSTPLA